MRLPENMREVLTAISHEMANSVTQTLIEGGRPVMWPPRRDGQASHLMGKTMALTTSMRTTATDTEAILGMGKGVPYAAIHNFGGTIKHPGSSKLQTFRIDGKWITTHGTKAHLIPMPKRQYMMFQPGDEDKYRIMVRNYIAAFIAANKTTRRTEL